MHKVFLLHKLNWNIIKTVFLAYFYYVEKYTTGLNVDCMSTKWDY